MNSANTIFGFLFRAAHRIAVSCPKFIYFKLQANANKLISNRHHVLCMIPELMPSHTETDYDSSSLATV